MKDPSARDTSARNNWFELLGLGISLAVLVIMALLVRNWMLDDAFISFRYVENLAKGHGLVYNIGERVEGYTNFLWVIILSVFRVIGLDTVSVSRILGLILSAAGLVLTWLLSRRVQTPNNRLSALATVIMLSTFGVFTAWGLSGMEVPLFTTLIVLTLLLFIAGFGASRPLVFALLSGCAAALTTMTRPEGLLLAGVIGAMLVLDAIRRRDGLPLLGFAAGFVAFYLPYYVWRFAYYGYPLPNTFYAKVGWSEAQIARGLGYLGSFARAYVPVLVLALAGAILAWKHILIRAATLVTLVFGLYVVLVGGDCMPAFRFVAPVAPIICLLAGYAIVSLASRIRRGSPATVVSIIAMVVLAGLNLLGSLRDPNVYKAITLDKVAWYGRIAGEELHGIAKPNALIATNTAGTIPYYSGLATVDMLGMNDLHIAHKSEEMGKGRAGHEKSDGAYVLARNPDYIQFGSAWGAREPYFRGDSEIFRSPEFRAGYVLKTYPLHGNLLLALYERRPPFLDLR